MTTLLRLNDAARTRLQAQVKLTGTFHHTLRNSQRVSAQVTVEIEQCDKAVYATVRGGPYVNSVTLDNANRQNATRLARFIEASANGYLSDIPEVDEYTLASDMELALRYVLRIGRGDHYLPVEDPETYLLMRRDIAGNPVATLEADDVQLQLALPRDRRAAFEVLKDNLARFLCGHRAAMAA